VGTRSTPMRGLYSADSYVDATCTASLVLRPHTYLKGSSRQPGVALAVRSKACPGGYHRYGYWSTLIGPMSPSSPQMGLIAWAIALAAVLVGGAMLLGGASPAATGSIERLQLVLAPPPVQPAVLAPVAAALEPTLVPSATATPAGEVLLPTPTVRPTVAPTATPTVRMMPVLADTFADNRLGWPDDETSTAWFTPEGYHIEPREPGRFAAVSPQASPNLADLQVTATFRTLENRPAGGGYGIIIRDEDARAHDGLNVGGRFYVLEVGDRGEVGIWRRERDHWVDLVPWTPSAAVHGGTAPNELSARAQGTRLTLSVNGVQAAQVDDAALQSGAVGVFAGGDGDAALLTRFEVEQLL
jgi:hypothetical protein